jgi:hypothetical protein
MRRLLHCSIIGSEEGVDLDPARPQVYVSRSTGLDTCEKSSRTVWYDVERGWYEHGILIRQCHLK